LKYGSESSIKKLFCYLSSRCIFYSSYRTYDTFEERAGASYGYKIDPMYWNSYNRRRRKVTIAIACLLWCIFGAVAQFTVVFWSTKRTQEYMDQRTELYNRELLDIKNNSKKTGRVKSMESEEDKRLFALYKQQKEDRRREIP
jgi:hypothetical protein